MLGLNPKNHIQVQKEKVYFVVACLLPPQNVKKGILCPIHAVMEKKLPKSVKHV